MGKDTPKKEKTPKKDKKEKKVKTPKKPDEGEDVAMGEGGASDIKVVMSLIANPLANDKLAKKCLKLVKKASKSKKLKRGVKEVVKALRKGEKGVVLLAGNISPIDVISHIPVLCEDNSIPYIYVPTKEELGQASLTKRPTSVVLLPKALADDDEWGDKLKESIKGIKAATPASW